MRRQLHMLPRSTVKLFFTTEQHLGELYKPDTSRMLQRLYSLAISKDSAHDGSFRASALRTKSPVALLVAIVSCRHWYCWLPFGWIRRSLISNDQPPVILSFPFATIILCPTSCRPGAACIAHDSCTNRQTPAKTSARSVGAPGHVVRLSTDLLFMCSTHASISPFVTYPSTHTSIFNYTYTFTYTFTNTFYIY